MSPRRLPWVDPPAPVQVVELPKPLPLPGQLKPLPRGKAPPEVGDPTIRVNEANAAARVQPVRAGFINAVRVYPFSGGALYQVYTAPGQVTDIALQVCLPQRCHFYACARTPWMALGDATGKQSVSAVMPAVQASIPPPSFPPPFFSPLGAALRS